MILHISASILYQLQTIFLFCTSLTMYFLTVIRQDQRRKIVKLSKATSWWRTYATQRINKKKTSLYYSSSFDLSFTLSY